MSTTYEIPAALLATLAADAVERDELREANKSMAKAAGDMSREIFDMSQHRLRESERAEVAERQVREATREIERLQQALTTAEDERQRVSLDLEGMREARDTLLGELGREGEAAEAAPINPDRPLEVGDRVRLIDANGKIGDPSTSPYLPGVQAGAVGTVVAVEDLTAVNVRWDGRGSIGHYTFTRRLERAS